MVEADIRDAVIFGRKLTLHRTLTFPTGENAILLTDTIENHGDEASPVMVLYHMNMGYPLLSEKAEVVIPSCKVLALKSDFVLSFCELIMGSKTGLEAIEKTVIDRAVQKIYQPYFADPRPENMPILSDLMAALTAQHIPEADRVAQALDLYVNGSLNFFNHRTTVDIRNRLVCFDIKGLGKNLKKPGMLIVQDAVWNTVTVNRSIGRATWYFVDEFHLLLKEEQTAAYSAEIWKRFRKWGGVPTGATQNPKDLLSSPEIENILENSDFIYLLNLSAGDRKLMTERLNISAEQLAYVTNADPGSGLLFFQNVILPFKDEFPKTTELYRLLTTKPSEVSHGGETG